MKKVTLFFAILFITVALNAQVQPTDTDGDGSYNISTLDHLRWVSENDSCWSWNFELDNDIDAGDTKNWNDGAGWSPIGNEPTYFSGRFDGNGYAIDSLYINRLNQSNVGFFGYTYESQINNLGISNFSVTGLGSVGGLCGKSYGGSIYKSYAMGSVSGSNYIGGLCGYNRSHISSCYATGTISGTYDYVGGLCGYHYSSSIDSSYATNTVTGIKDYVGGLCGDNEGGDIDNSYATGSVAGNFNVGGLCGKNSGGSLFKSYATGSVAGNSSIGGLCGYNYGSQSGSIVLCYATGSVSGSSSIGGLCGENNGYYTSGYNRYALIDRSYATGSVSGVSFVGGLCGYNRSNIDNSYATGSVSGSSSVGGLFGKNDGYHYESNYSACVNNCYATGSVSGSSSVGGLCGENTVGSSITNSFWDTQTSGQNTSAAGKGKPTAKMKTKSTFTYADWDFGTIWAIESNINDSYPYLKGLIITKSAQPTDTDGDGYYNISTLDHLRWVSENDSCWSWNFELDNDINANDTKNWNNGEGWSPIGDSINRFKGIFEGNGYAIDSLYVNRPKQAYVGLFGFIKGSQINNIAMSNCSVTGTFYVGGLLGYGDYFTLKNSYTTGSINGIGDYVGGLVGMSYNNSVIKDCYSMGSITGGDYVGGLVGESCYSEITQSYSGGSITGGDYVGGFAGNISSSSVIRNSYTTSSVTGNSGVGGFTGKNDYSIIADSYSIGSVAGNDNVGGFIGDDNIGMLMASFWDTETSGQNTSASEGKKAVEGKTTAAMKTKSTFTDAGWNFTVIWEIDASINGGYPYLNYRSRPVTVGIEPLDTDIDGSRNISLFAHLVWISEHQNSWAWGFELDNDINASSSKYWETLLGFSPIGNETTKFTGNFDGHGYAIDSLYIDRPSQAHVGLFGYTEAAQINNIVVLNCKIKGQSFVGGLVGVNFESSTITNSYSTGSVVGSYDWVGGLVGVNLKSSIIINSYSTANVTGSRNRIGGLVGYNSDSSIIKNSYATGSLAGMGCVGGLVGDNSESTITNSYATGSINGSGDGVGGLVGANFKSTITNSYATGSVTGSKDVGGLVGNNFNYAISHIINSYSTGSVIGSRNVGGLVGYNDSSEVANSFWDFETSGIDSSDGGTGKTTAEMKTKSTFTDAGWDFENIWAIDGITNDGYPFFGTTTGVVIENILPTANLTCSPNPCTTSSKIAYSVNNAGFVNIAVYDMLGNEVAILINNYQAAGEHEVVFNAEELAAGVYFITINTNETMETKKIIVAR